MFRAKIGLESSSYFHLRLDPHSSSSDGWQCSTIVFDSFLHSIQVYAIRVQFVCFIREWFPLDFRSLLGGYLYHIIICYLFLVSIFPRATPTYFLYQLTLYGVIVYICMNADYKWAQLIRGHFIILFIYRIFS